MCGQEVMARAQAAVRSTVGFIKAKAVQCSSKEDVRREQITALQLQCDAKRAALQREASAMYALLHAFVTYVTSLGTAFVCSKGPRNPSGQPCDSKSPFMLGAHAHDRLAHSRSAPRKPILCCNRDQARVSRELLQLAAQRFHLEAPDSTASSPAAVIASLHSYDSFLSKELQVGAMLSPLAARLCCVFGLCYLAELSSKRDCK